MIENWADEQETIKNLPGIFKIETNRNSNIKHLITGIRNSINRLRNTLDTAEGWIPSKINENIKWKDETFKM